MRTTVRLDDDLHAAVKIEAAATGRTFTEILHEALHMWLCETAGIGTGFTGPLPVFGGRGVQPGVDLDDQASLLDLLDGRSRV